MSFLLLLLKIDGEVGAETKLGKLVSKCSPDSEIAAINPFVNIVC